MMPATPQITITPANGATNVRADVPIRVEIAKNGFTLVPDTVSVAVNGVVAWYAGVAKNGWAVSIKDSEATVGYTLLPPDGFSYGSAVRTVVDVIYD